MILNGKGNGLLEDLSLLEGSNADHLKPREKADDGFELVQLKYGPYSPSRLAVAKCPERFFGRYINKEAAPLHSVAADRGSAIHEVFSKIIDYKKANDGANPSVVEIENWSIQAVVKYPASYEESNMISSAAQAYIAKQDIFDAASSFTEYRFALKLYEKRTSDDSVPFRQWVIDLLGVDSEERVSKEDGFFFVGFIDRLHVDHINQVVTIIDYKTSPHSNLSESNTFQIGCYAWVCSKYFPGYEIKSVFYYCQPHLACYRHFESWSHEELNSWESMILSKIQAIEHFSEFPAVVGSHCDLCHRILSCSAYDRVKESYSRGSLNLHNPSPADLEALTEAYTLTEKMFEEMKKALRKGIENHVPTGRVFANGMAYGFATQKEAVDWIQTDERISKMSAIAKHKIESGDYKPEELERLKKQAEIPNLNFLLEKFNINPVEFKEWSSKKLEKINYFDEPELLDLLKEYTVKSRSTKFQKQKL